MRTNEPKTGEQKADFSGIYDQPDPRSYFRALTPLDYQIPQTALPVIERVHAGAGRERSILDVCCSYGINGGLLRYDIDLAELSARYTEPSSDDVSPDKLAEADLAFLAERPREPQPTVYGLDAAPNAIDYAKRTGLITDGWSADLESNDAPPELAEGARDVGLIICTGGVGYVGGPTFQRLVQLTRDPADVWLAVFVLRAFTYDAIANALDGFGLVTEQVPDRTFVQRRFDTEDEQQAAIDDVISRGLDPAGKEADGWFHADCYITRPAHAAAQTPLADLLA